ncbi:uncharacterized protein B0T23DRAFT_373566 [Neurospora hispaniola]|uniref:Uncharacterized protein n=1 Tax=Neurospora hispaniola TaxID=588809 RepID=A0AAJ0ICA5_9PEZI|nr:hypothetical protein B0T23DRAFT_373566 [Neurospora hispaniola]
MRPSAFVYLARVLLNAFVIASCLLCFVRIFFSRFAQERREARKECNMVLTWMVVSLLQMTDGVYLDGRMCCVAFP